MSPIMTVEKLIQVRFTRRWRGYDRREVHQLLQTIGLELARRDDVERALRRALVLARRDMR